MIKLLNEPINDLFYDLVSLSTTKIRLCAPYVKNEIIQEIYSLKKQDVSVDYISNFSLPNFYKKSSDIEAFDSIARRNDRMFNCQLLHAKLYIFDDKKAIVTSANLTSSGFKRNIEYGVYLEEPGMVNQSLLDYKSICNNSDTGKITPRKIQNIKSILNHLPKYCEMNFDSYNDVNEVDSILEIDKKLILHRLSDWKKEIFCVVDDLNMTEFALADVYEREYIFKKKFPNNNTIKDSMRRNLQELRDLGLIKFPGNGNYKKLWR